MFYQQRRNKMEKEKQCEYYSDHEWDLEIFPGICTKCGASYLKTSPTEKDIKRGGEITRIQDGIFTIIKLQLEKWQEEEKIVVLEKFYNWDIRELARQIRLFFDGMEERLKKGD